LRIASIRSSDRLFRRELHWTTRAKPVLFGLFEIHLNQNAPDCKRSYCVCNGLLAPIHLDF
jgi:hypothetical protein